MNETVRRKLNGTETILEFIPAYIEAFVSFYGEEERENITRKFNNMLVVGYSNPNDLSYIIRKSNKSKSEELINEFLNKFLQEKEEQEKFKKIFFKDNTFEYTSLMPIQNYIEYKKNIGEYQSLYIKKDVVEFLRHLNPETTVDNLDELISSGIFKNIDTIIPIYNQMLDEYKKYELEMKSYSDYVEGCNNLEASLNKKYKKLLIHELKDLFTEKEYQTILEKMNSKYFYSVHDVNGKTKNYTAYSLNGTTLAEAFSKKNEELLHSGKDYQKKSIIRDRIEYFKNLGIDLGDDYQAYLDDSRIRDLIPSYELIERIKNVHKELYTKMMDEYYKSILEYQKNRDRINQLDLLDKEDGYDANLYDNRRTCVCPNIKLQNGVYGEYPLFFINIGFMEEMLDHAIVHELNHVYELSLQELDNNECTFICGWDILKGNISSKSSDVVSLEKREEKREYELFNEIINELIAQEISEIMSQSEQYIFNTKEDKKIKGGTSYESTKILVSQFYDTYKKEIIDSRKNGNIEVIFNAVGKENFEELNKLFYEYQEYFNIGLGMLQVYEDLQNNVETELTKKFKDLVEKRNDILIKMEEYYKSKEITR